MLDEIRIEDLGVISTAHVSFGPGLTVITGETGAGKTMVLTGLALLLGERADPGGVRPGADRAVVEGRVLVAPDSAVARRAQEAGADLDDDGGLVLVRTVAAEGRSRAYLGGRSVPQSVLGELAEHLVTVHGQADQVRLRSPRRQREALDDFAGPEHRATLTEYRAAWAERSALLARRADLVANAQERAREAELLRLGLAEVERVDPRPGEDVELAAEAERLGHAEDLREAAARAHALLSGSPEDPTSEESAAVALLDGARRSLEQGGAHDPRLADLAARVGEAGYLVADVVGEVSGYLTELHADPARLEQVNARRAELRQLTRSYGTDVAEVLRWAEDARARLAEIDGGAGSVEHLDEQIAQVAGRLEELAARLSSGRRAAAVRLSQAVTQELAGLAMPDATLTVDVTPEELGPWGADAVQMLLVPHAGAAARPLGKGASGGELSRVMLALEVALATAVPADAEQRPPTFVFDEVDAGVGGRAAVEVGRRLATLATDAQVIVVTHLAQVAAFADTHLVVTKGGEGITVADVRRVDGEERVQELARMLSGQDDSESARAHAAELLELSGMGR